MTHTNPGARAGTPYSTGGQDVTLLWIFAVLLRERRTLIAFIGAGLIIAVAVATLRKPMYTTTLSFVPQAGQDQSRAGLAGLAGQFGISLGVTGGSQSPQLYADLLATRAVLVPIAQESFGVGGRTSARVPLSTFLGITGRDSAVVLDNTVRALRTSVVSTSVATRTTGVVTVSVRTRSPHVSLQLAQRLVQQLDVFNLATRQSQAREERRFTEERLHAARASLRKAEFAVLTFLQTNRQFSGSPHLVFARDTLQREVTLQIQVVSTLAQQYEDVRIREVRDTPVITVIERPSLPARSNPRGLALLIVMGFVGSFGLGILVVLFRDAMRRERAKGDDPAFGVLSSEWKKILGRSAED